MYLVGAMLHNARALSWPARTRSGHKAYAQDSCSDLSSPSSTRDSTGLVLARFGVFEIVVLSAYVLWVAVMVAHHRVWRDEAQAWLIARESPLWFDVVRQVAYEGTPPLWHLLLFPLAHSGLPVVSMQILNALLAIPTAALVLSWRSLGRLLQCSLLASVFFAHEYPSVARSYLLSVLLLFLYGTRYARRLKRPFLSALLLGLLSWTNVCGFILAGVLAALLLWESLTTDSPRRVALVLSGSSPRDSSCARCGC